MAEVKFYRCKKCGEVVYKVVDGPCTPVCCGEPMEELVANTTDAATEKHVPVIEHDGDKLVVKVGSVAHPMLEEHSIQFIALVKGETVIFKHLKPGDAPEATFCAKGAENAVAYEFCNLHGLWKAEA